MRALTPCTLVVALVAGCSSREPDRTRAADTAASAPAVASVPADTPATPAAAPPTPSATRPAVTPRPATPATKPSTPIASTPAPKPAPTPAAGDSAASPTATVSDPYHPAARDTLDSDTYQGWKQFELNCSRCHGEYAVGTSFAPALVVSLREGGTIPTKEAFITTVCAGRMDKGMPSWCALGLEMNKIEEIYSYLKGRADGKIAAGRPAQKE